MELYRPAGVHNGLHIRQVSKPHESPPNTQDTPPILSRFFWWLFCSADGVSYTALPEVDDTVKAKVAGRREWLRSHSKTFEPLSGDPSHVFKYTVKIPAAEEVMTLAHSVRHTCLRPYLRRRQRRLCLDIKNQPRTPLHYGAMHPLTVYSALSHLTAPTPQREHPECPDPPRGLLGG